MTDLVLVPIFKKKEVFCSLLAPGLEKSVILKVFPMESSSHLSLKGF